MNMATFYITHKIKGVRVKFRVFQHYESTWYIEFKRGQKRSLKTTDRNIAKRRAEIAVVKYFEKKIVEIKKSQRQTLSVYFQQFLADKDYDSIKTEKNYKTAVSLLIDFIGDKDISQYTDQDIKKFKTLHRQKRLDKRSGQVTKISINTYLRHIRSVFRKAKDDGVIPSVPRIDFFKTESRLPVILSEENKKKLLSYIKNEDPEFYRICLFALFTGCRRSEIVSANWENLKVLRYGLLGKEIKKELCP